MKGIIINVVFFLCLLISCQKTQEKFTLDRSNIIDARNIIKEIKFEGDLFSSASGLTSFKDYYIVIDPRSVDEQIHIFDNRTFKHLLSTGPLGHANNEIVRIGLCVGLNEIENSFYITDYGKMRLLEFCLDSLLNISDNASKYIPNEKLSLDMNIFPNDYTYISDTFCIAQIIEPTSNNSYTQRFGKWNMQSNNYLSFKYEYPNPENARIGIGISAQDNLMVVCHKFFDLFSILDLKGGLKYNIYGTNWRGREPSNKYHYKDAVIANNKIFMSYSGKVYEYTHKDCEPNYIEIYTLNGDYVKTLDIGSNIIQLCYDEYNNRLLLTTDGNCQFAYIDLNEIEYL